MKSTSTLVTVSTLCVALCAAPAWSQSTLDPATGVAVDPTTGAAIDPATGAVIDPTTGLPVDPTASTALDQATMHAALDGYGQWMRDGTWGDVWVPTVAGEFVPYGTQGQWLQTDAGWYWQSEFPWGWVAFHYGRWVRLATTWAWVPDGTFGPAWVDWRSSSDGYIAWAPLPPNGVPDAGTYAYCPSSAFGTSGFWSSVYYGPTATTFYPRTIAMPTRVGPRGVVYAVGPFDAMHPAGIPVGQVWRADMQRGYYPRIGAPAGVGAPRWVGPRVWNAPVYRPPANYGAMYNTPTMARPPGYVAPAYPAPGYAAPAYRPPVYTAPVARPAAPGWGGGGWRGGGWRGGAWGGGGGWHGGGGGWHHGGRR